jgi:hypothetical protein
VIQGGVQVITNDPAIDLHYCMDMVIEGAPLRLGCKIEPVATHPRSLLGDVEHALKGERRALVGHLQKALEREIKGTGPVTDPEVADRRLAGMARLRKGRNPHAQIEGKALGHDPPSVLRSEAHISPGHYLLNPSCHPML